jgi:hypothetical protein
MKKHFLLLSFATSMLSLSALSACPCGFSPDDARPFFEQYESSFVKTSADKYKYEEKITPQPPIEEKEEKS